MGRSYTDTAAATISGVAAACGRRDPLLSSKPTGLKGLGMPKHGVEASEA